MRFLFSLTRMKPRISSVILISLILMLPLSSIDAIERPVDTDGLQTRAVFPFDDARYQGADVHDPSVILFGDRYVMVATSGNQFVPIWTSKDRIHWDQHGPILNASPAWLAAAVPNHHSVWAPAPLKIGNMLRIYYCASQKFGSNTSFIGMIENEHFDPHNPVNGWTDKGMLVESHAEKDNFNAIDPDVLTGPDGRQWMVYGSYWSGIYEVEIEPSTGLIKEGAIPFHVASNTGERGNPLEAPMLRYHEGYYYLFVTYGLAAQGVRSTYRTMVGRSKDPKGPFLGFDGRSMEEGGHTDLLKSSPPMFAPGGGNMFSDHDGDWFAYHYYDSTRHWHGDVWGRPTLQIRKVVWGPDGWPLPGLPAGIDLETSAKGTVEGEWTQQVDFGDTGELFLEGSGVARLGENHGHWDLNGQVLVIKWPKLDTPGESWTDTLTVDDSKQCFVGRNQAGVVIRGIKRNAKVWKL